MTHPKSHFSTENFDDTSSERLCRAPYNSAAPNKSQGCITSPTEGCSRNLEGETQEEPLPSDDALTRAAPSDGRVCAPTVEEDSNAAYRREAFPLPKSSAACRRLDFLQHPPSYRPHSPRSPRNQLSSKPSESDLLPSVAAMTTSNENIRLLQQKLAALSIPYHTMDVELHPHQTAEDDHPMAHGAIVGVGGYNNNGHVATTTTTATTTSTTAANAARRLILKCHNNNHSNNHSNNHNNHLPHEAKPSGRTEVAIADAHCLDEVSSHSSAIRKRPRPPLPIEAEVYRTAQMLRKRLKIGTPTTVTTKRIHSTGIPMAIDFDASSVAGGITGNIGGITGNALSNTTGTLLSGSGGQPYYSVRGKRRRAVAGIDKRAILRCTECGTELVGVYSFGDYVECHNCGNGCNFVAIKRRHSPSS